MTDQTGQRMRRILRSLKANDGDAASQLTDIPSLIPTPTALRPGSKLAMVVALLTRENGASLADVITATGWLPHSSRAALTGLRKKGYPVTAVRVDGVTHYHLRGAGDASPSSPVEA